jgi:amino acid transporter
VGLTFVGLLISSDDPGLLGGGGYIDVNASPFVLVGKYAGLNGFDTFMNIVILVSVISIGVSGVYGGSRTLTALGEQGYAPKIFTYIDRSGRPLFSVAFLLAFGALAYVNLAAAGPEIFAWLQALSGLAALFTWGSICLAHIRFRKAWAYHGHTLDEIPFKAIGGVYGSWIGLGIIVLVLIAQVSYTSFHPKVGSWLTVSQFYTAISPIGSNVGTAESFFKSYLAAPVVLFFWVIGYFWKRKAWLRTSEMDVDTGRRELDWDYINAQRAEEASWSAPKRWFRKVF